jgi:hypothetical protein
MEVKLNLFQAYGVVARSRGEIRRAKCVYVFPSDGGYNKAFNSRKRV